jgi:diaminohydroxyphosphoribosylaminopyrimidine deaminase/5-amino-6-(5-phosphoribosylamino)uracil reductase
MSNAERAIEEIRRSDTSKPFVVAQLGQSLDGRIALPSGESKYINGPAALDHLHRLRAVADAVVVGISTVMSDDPLLTVRRVAGQNPARVIIDPNGRLNGPRRCLDRNGAPVLLLRKRGCDAPVPESASVLYLDGTEKGFPCQAIVRALAEHGFRRLLVEGGAATVSRFFEEGELDRLHLLFGPVFLGEGKTGLNLPAPSCLAAAVRVVPDIYPLDHGEVLLDCPLRNSAREALIGGKPA